MYEIKSEIGPKNIYSVADLNGEIKTLLETTIPMIWVEGEISNLKFHSSGHLYLSLKDKESQISSVMWRSRNHSLFFTPQDGMKVLVFGKISVYQKRGSYQLDIVKMQPSGIGELQLAFEQLKQRLLEEGLFDDEFKKELPQFPERIGIVTSPTGAALQDLINILRRRFPGIEIILNPVKVQGEGAALEIANGIDEFNEYNNVDLLIIGRGGGSLEDLWAFNEEVVARSIFRSKIPVISAVGHEIDFSISDFVSDLRAPTPSAAAELAIPDHQELIYKVGVYKKNLIEMVNSLVQYNKDKLNSLIKSYSIQKTPDIVRQRQQRLDELTHSMELSMNRKVNLSANQVDSLNRRLKALAPESILKRGYSICYNAKNNENINDASSLSENDEIHLQFYKGRILTNVKKIEDLNLFKQNKQNE